MLGSFYKWLMSWTRLFGMLWNYQEIFRFLQDCTTGVVHHKNNICTLRQLIYYRPASSFSYSMIFYLEEVYSRVHIFYSAPLFFIVTMGIHTVTFIQELSQSSQIQKRLDYAGNWWGKHYTLAVLLVWIISALQTRKCHKTQAGRQSHIAYSLCSVSDCQVAHSFSKDLSSSETSHKHIIHWQMNHCQYPVDHLHLLCVGTAAKLDTPVQRWWMVLGCTRLVQVRAGRAPPHTTHPFMRIYSLLQAAVVHTFLIPEHLVYYLKWDSCFILVDHYHLHRKQPFSGTKSQYSYV